MRCAEASLEGEDLDVALIEIWSVFNAAYGNAGIDRDTIERCVAVLNAALPTVVVLMLEEPDTFDHDLTAPVVGEGGLPE